MSIISLERFIITQEHMYAFALEEIKRGQKCSHWIWCIFPQLRGLGDSYEAEAYGISGLEEAKAYLAHPLLSQRLIEISEALLAHRGKDIRYIMGSGIDAVKLRSSMTLFALASEDNSVFHRVLDCFYGGEYDPLTVDKLKSENSY